jgi:hypothetical protein
MSKHRSVVRRCSRFVTGIFIVDEDILSSGGAASPDDRSLELNAIIQYRTSSDEGARLRAELRLPAVCRIPRPHVDDDLVFHFQRDLTLPRATGTDINSHALVQQRY